MKRLDAYWYEGNVWLWLLWPVSLLFCLIALLRRTLYRLGLLRTVHFDVPLIVVGNITVGGSGKTPLVLWLADFLRQHGYRPGLVSRGYGGKAQVWPHAVTAESDAALVGDEALLLARRSGCPMVVGPDRAAAVARLLSDTEVDVVISDDGMQHYRMGRDLEVAVLDGERRLGNGLCLPAGPLREGKGRLRRCDFVVTNGKADAGEWAMSLIPGAARHLCDDQQRELATFTDSTVHAVAGIGNPGRFFAMLRSAGLSVTEHPFADHHPYQHGELEFADGASVLMTEKDAVKYFDFADTRHWYLPVEACLPEAFGAQLLARLEKRDGQKTA